jgi:hypothetical protein
MKAKNKVSKSNLYVLSHLLLLSFDDIHIFCYLNCELLLLWNGLNKTTCYDTMCKRCCFRTRPKNTTKLVHQLCRVPCPVLPTGQGRAGWIFFLVSFLPTGQGPKFHPVDISGACVLQNWLKPEHDAKRIGLNRNSSPNIFSLKHSLGHRLHVCNSYFDKSTKYNNIMCSLLLIFVIYCRVYDVLYLRYILSCLWCSWSSLYIVMFMMFLIFVIYCHV